MSDMELDYSDIPRAFEGESASKSSTTGLDSADSENAGRVRGAVVSTESGSTSSVEVVEVNNA